MYLAYDSRTCLLDTCRGRYLEMEPPFVALSDLGCLRLYWTTALFTFMGRYQFELDQMCKECRERFGSTQSGSCTTCGKHIQQNLGKHVAL